jgi:hypothetical protein
MEKNLLITTLIKCDIIIRGRKINYKLEVGLVMTNENKLSMIQALRQFKDAYNELNKTWVEGHTTDEGFDLNDTEAVRFYPFHKSFDELNVNEWCNEEIAELSGDVKNVKVLNPICATCTVCTEVTQTITGSPLEPYRQCLADADCGPMYIPYNRDLLVTHIFEVDKDIVQDDFSDQLEHYIMDGLTGLNDLTDYEILDIYCTYVGEEVPECL